MIICFTATGNSMSVAKHLQNILGDELVRPAPGMMINPRLMNLCVDDGRVIWVFPVHAWGLPVLTQNVIRRANITSDSPLVHHMVCTCGDDIGYTDHEWRGMIEARGWKTGSAFSVQMPNNYVFMRGFDVDSQQIAEEKLSAMPQRVEQIAYIIDSSDENVVDVVRGSVPWLKSTLLRKYFFKCKMSIKPFRANSSCVGCGRCAQACPTQAIAMVDGQPYWKPDGMCVMCSRCYHGCPTKAIEYGNATNGKGQYLCPGYLLK